jgi:hypothetical protein
MHRSLFHPLATLRHRIGAGTWNRQDKTKHKTKESIKKAVRSTDSKLTCAFRHLALRDDFTSYTKPNLNIKFLTQYATPCTNIPACRGSTSSSVPSLICSLQLQTFSKKSQRNENYIAILNYRPLRKKIRHNEVRITMFISSYSYTLNKIRYILRWGLSADLLPSNDPSFNMEIKS